MEGDTKQAPFEWIVSRICEEFKCLPSAALRELLHEPHNMALDIIELRAYARAKDTLENARKPEDVPDDPMIDMVFEIQERLRREGDS